MGPRHRCRGSGTGTASPAYTRLASMGPRHRCRGSCYLVARSKRQVPLQWGRDIAVADRFRTARQASRRRSRFNGAATSLSRIGVALAREDHAQSASMGPRHRCRGSDASAAVNASYSVASMGPRHRCRGSCGYDEPRRDQVCFNGAATSLSRIGKGTWGFRTYSSCFNGAATSLSRIASAQRELARRLNASMGPRHRCRGSVQISSLTPSQCVLQWGRDIAVADRTSQGAQATKAPRFNGAATSLSRIGSVRCAPR